MGLSAFSAMRARAKARELADKNSESSALKVQEVSAPKVEENVVAEESATIKTSKKKTDAEKLKKKE
jgi:hypothetical protein